MRLWVIGLAAVLLTACGQGGGSPSGGPDKSAVFMDASAAATDAAAAGEPSAPGASAPVGVPMLAYRYAFGVEAPAGKLRGLIAGHEAACAAAGPQLCQVTSSGVHEAGEDRLMGTLELRAAPAWLKRFRDGLAADARSAGGRITSSGVTSEDLSRQIVDVEARLRAMTTLRDRLQALLADRPGKLSDLVEIERELARVQGEIDSTTSQLAVMRGRVAMSEVSLDYQSEGVLAPSGVWSPLTGAFKDFIGIVAWTLAAMVRLIAWCAPWVLLGAGLLWLLRKRLPKRLRLFGRKTPPEV